MESAVKRAFVWILCVTLGQAVVPAARAGVFGTMDFATSVKNITAYKSKATIQFSLDPNQMKDKKVLRLEYQMESQGYCGITQPVNQNWSTVTGLKLFGRGTPGKILQITLVDAGSRHFIYNVLFPNDEWNVFDVPLEEFSLNPYFQPPTATIKSETLMLGNIKEIQFAPTQPGKGVFYLNQVVVEGLAGKRRGGRPTALFKGGFVFFNRRLSFANLDKYLPYTDVITLNEEEQVTAGVWQGHQFLGATLQLMADANNLYVYATVKETDPAFNVQTGGNLWNGDCIELFIGFDHEVKRRYGAKDFQIGLSPGKGGTAPTAYIFNRGQEYRNAQVTSEPRADGYTLKAQLPLATLDLGPLEDPQRMFMDVAVAKAGPDGNRVLQLTWNGKGLSHIDPTQWSEAVVASDRNAALALLDTALQAKWLKAQSAEVVVDISAPTRPISPYVYGINAFPAVQTPGGWMDYSPAAVAVYKDIRLTMLRFPGGDWGDEHTLEASHLKEFIDLCRKLKTEPMIQVRLHQSSAQQAADLVNLCNRQKKYRVKYWAIGNEPDFFETKHFTTETYRVQDYVRDFQAFSRAMKAVDPSILVCGPELAQYTYDPDKPDYPFDKAGKSWMETFLKACGKDVDLVTFHHYPLGGANGVADWRAEMLLQTTSQWEERIGGLRKEILKLTGRNIPIGVTEINSDWSGLFNGEATPDTFPNALWWTITLGELITQGVSVVDFFALYDTGSYGIVTRELGTLPAYMTYRCYEGFGDALLQVRSDNDNLKVYAGRDRKRTTVLFVNRQADVDIRALVTFKGQDRVRSVTTYTYTETEYLNAQSFSENVIKFSPQIEHTFPRYSITKFVLE
jgi:hypothetical protein